MIRLALKPIIKLQKIQKLQHRTVLKNENNQPVREIPKERYVSAEERWKIIYCLKLI